MIQGTPLEPCRNPRHEAFCIAIVGGQGARQAYVFAGYKDDAANARNLASRPKIKARIEALRGKGEAVRRQRIQEAAVARAVMRTAITKEWVLDQLRQNVERASTAVPVVNFRGEKTGLYKFDANGVNRALELIGKELGMFSPNREENSFRLDRQRFERMTEAERLAENRALLEEARAKIAAYKATLLEQDGGVRGPVIDVNPHPAE
jgi:hypothetical protein